MSFAETPASPGHAVDGPYAGWMLGLFVLLLSLSVCLPGLWLLRILWTRSEFYGHAYAVPLVSAYLIWRNRDQIREALRELHPPAMGAPLLFAVASLEVVMVMGDIGFGASAGIPVVLGSAAYAIGGRPLLRPFLLPLVFLVFMVPPPGFLRDELLVQLKLLVTEVSVTLLQTAGHVITADGNRVLIPDHTLFVADACSGMTSITTLLPLSAIVAFFLSHGIWRRTLVVGSVVPLAVLANVIRVVVTVSMVSRWGIEFAEGILHESFGMVTYIVGTLALIGVTRVLK